jgi:hypothetical protein
MFCKVQSVQSFTTRCSDDGMTTMTTLIEEQFRNSTEMRTYEQKSLEIIINLLQHLLMHN